VSLLEDVLRHAASCFHEIDMPWALVGGLAVSVRTEPRFTRDIDVAAVVSDDATAESVIGRLRERGFRPTMIVEQEAVRRLATVRLLPPRAEDVDLMVDLLFASSGIEAEICAEADVLEVFPDLLLPVATPAHLLALKILSRDDRSRPQDGADIRQLLCTMDQAAIMHTREACRLIEVRGFHRNRDLQGALEASMQESADA
jgi:hypothetical protein